MPVPVAPATSPCRLTMPSGIRIRVSESRVASSISPPSSSAGPSNAYPGDTAATIGSCSTGSGSSLMWAPYRPLV